MHNIILHIYIRVHVHTMYSKSVTYKSTCQLLEPTWETPLFWKTTFRITACLICGVCIHTLLIYYREQLQYSIAQDSTCTEELGKVKWTCSVTHIHRGETQNCHSHNNQLHYVLVTLVYCSSILRNISYQYWHLQWTRLLTAWAPDISIARRTESMTR